MRPGQLVTAKPRPEESLSARRAPSMKVKFTNPYSHQEHLLTNLPSTYILK